MYIYLDIIWLLNFLFDFMLLLLTAIILKRKIVKWRIFLAALLGSTIVLLMFMPIQSLASHPIVKILFSCLIILTAFGYKKFRYFFQGLLTFYFTTFMIGGGMIGVHYFFEYEVSITNNVMATSTTGFGDPISWLFVFIGFPLAWYFSKQQIDHIETKKIHYDQIVTVEVSIDHISFSLKGLIDSGNQLYDPISKSPVMILDTKKIEHILPKSILEQSKNLDSLGTNTTEESHPWESRIRLVPYRAVGQDHQFLLALKPDEITLYYNNEKIRVKKALVALNHTTLSSVDEYQCIVHPKMLITSSVQPAS
ncbi:sigma-E processing peptidase SpoIIGA [Bacillus sp. PS06]|uniref:sigma-E processing peptidase SpoIIGA n=1 Tax=Bacillus sp. PS06 TaxID=2764176 RepID=UPI00177A7F06|nr:sigma-E processing peptidase SpoIIGA [Bacillus sp. PS06]MBD8068381.1 sigma-E processing peptidase SpoIIGA [Bacillus sp. PS06]